MSEQLRDLLDTVRPFFGRPARDRLEVGQGVFDWLKVAATPEGGPPENPWRRDGDVPPPPGGAMFGVPVVVCEDLAAYAWRLLDSNGLVIEEGTL